jgi:ribonucleoside-diphosphate reductase alpha chain/ribonucleoside-triphosphate reductase
MGFNSKYEAYLLDYLKEVVHEECDNYSKELRIPRPLIATTVKPEGTLSQVAGGVSSGLHVSHSPYYIRRIRINSNDPLVKVAEAIGWNVEKDLVYQNTHVVDFPVKTGATSTRDAQTVDSQFDTYFMFQDFYTDHNSSNTISVREDEWERCEEIVWENWDNFVGVSFLAYDGGSYLQAPYEEISEETYHELRSKMAKFDPKLLQQFESGNSDENDAGNDGCEAGICPIR